MSDSAREAFRLGGSGFDISRRLSRLTALAGRLSSLVLRSSINSSLLPVYHRDHRRVPRSRVTRLCRRGSDGQTTDRSSLHEDGKIGNFAGSRLTASTKRELESGSRVTGVYMLRGRDVPVSSCTKGDLQAGINFPAIPALDRSGAARDLSVAPICQVQ